MRSKIIFIIPVLLLLAGAGYYGLMMYPKQRFQAEVDAWIKDLPAGYTATYKTVDYSFLDGRARIAQLALHGPASTGLEATVDEIDVDKPELGFEDAFRKAKADPGTVTADTVLPVFGHLTVKNAAFHQKDVRVAIDSFELNGARLYPKPLLQPGVSNLADLAPSLMKLDQTARIEDFIPLLRAEAATVLAAAYDGYSAENLHANIRVPAAAGGKPVNEAFSIKHMAGSGDDRGSFGEGSADGIVIRIEGVGNEAVEHMTMSKLELRQPLQKILADPTPGRDSFDGFGLGRYEITNLVFKPKDEPALRLGSFSISDVAVANGMPVSASLSMKGLRITKALLTEPQAQDAFDKLDLKAVTLSFGVSYAWDVAAKHVTLKDTFVKADELGTVTLSADVTDLAPGAGLENPGSLAHAKLRYDDASFARRALAMAAAQNGGDIPAMRKQLIATVRQQAAALGKDPIVSEVSDAMIQFLQAPKSFTVELAPAKPVPLLSLAAAESMAPPQIATLLGLTVTANQPAP